MRIGFQGIIDRVEDSSMAGESQRGALSFRLGLALILISLAVVPVLANITINLSKILGIVETVQREKSITTLRESSTSFSQKIIRCQETIRLLAGVFGVRDFLKGYSEELSTEIVARRVGGLLMSWFGDQPDITTVTLYRSDGREAMKLIRDSEGRLVALPPELFSVSEEIRMKIGKWQKSGDSVFFSIIMKRLVRYEPGGHSHEPLIKLCSIIRDADDSVVGVAEIIVNIGNLLEQSRFQFLATGSGILINWHEKRGCDHTHPRGNLFLQFPEMKQAVQKGHPIVLRDRNGNEVAWFPIFAGVEPETSLWVGKEVDISLAKEVRRSMLSRVAMVSLAALCVILLILFRYSRAIDQYRTDLVDSLRKVLLGESHVRLDWDRPPEMAELARDLNMLFEKFRRNEEERLAAMEKLAELSEKMRLILDSAAEGIIEVNRDNDITFVNRAACEILGFSHDELIGSDIHSILHYVRQDRDQHPKDDCPFCRPMAEERFNIFEEATFWTRDGEPIHVEYITTPVKDHLGQTTGMVICLRDITNRKNAEEKAKVYEEQLRQAQKMEAIGTLAGGVAHDFNNLLTAVQGYSELLEMDLEGNEKALKQIKNIQKAAERAASLVRQLLAFSRKQVAEKSVVDVNQLMSEQQAMLKRLIGEDIALEIMTSEEPAEVLADPNMLAQVIMNMVVNARDALQGRNERRICLQVALRSFTGRDEPENPEGRSGRFVMIAVSDTGHGMDEEMIDRIFDPFFTTKEVGKGTGLGLAVAYGIVEQHGGWIYCSSALGEGTTFMIFLPVIDPAARPVVRRKTEGERPEDWRPLQIGRGRRAFVVEDDPMVLEISTDMLNSMGFDVVSVGTVAEARRYIEENGGDVDLVMSDVVLPDGNGVEFVEALMDDRPDILVLLVSGYVDERIHMETIHGRQIPFLAKPFTVHDLQEAIIGLIERS